MKYSFFSFLAISLFGFYSVKLDSQTILYEENFNNCTLPQGWNSDIVFGQDGWKFGTLASNGAANPPTMDGSCFLYFDDDILGENAPNSRASITTGAFDLSNTAIVYLAFDLVFRKSSQDEILDVYIKNDNRIELVASYNQGVGEQPNQFQTVYVDISKFRGKNSQIIFEYDDGQEWNWWVGIDNLKLIGAGTINDICDQAIAIDINQPCLGLDNSISQYIPENISSCAPNSIRPLYYKFTAASDQNIDIVTNSRFNDNISVYTGVCGNLTQVSCTNYDEHGFQGERLRLSAAANTTYYIIESGVHDRYGKSSGQACIKLEPTAQIISPPLNDNCLNSINIPNNQPCVTGTVVGADAQSLILAQNKLARSDVWYDFTPDVSGKFQFASNADFADNLVLYSGACNNLSLEAIDVYGQTMNTSNLTAGQKYFVRVLGGFATVEGSLCITASNLDGVIPNNTICTTAQSVSLGTDCIAGSNLSSNIQGPRPSCVANIKSSVWYKFVSPASGKIKLSTGADFYHVISIYKGTCTSLEEIFCSKNPQKCTGYLDVIGLNPNQGYFIQIASTEGSFGYTYGNYCLEILDGNDPTEYNPMELAVGFECLGDGFGKMSYTVAGGEGSYTIVGNEEDQILQTGQIYGIVVKDAIGCEVSYFNQVDCGPITCDLAAQAYGQDIQCSGLTNGAAGVSFFGEYGNVTYQWSNGSTVKDISDLTAGFYTVTITDDKACTSMATIEIKTPDPIVITLVEVKPQFNQGTPDGEIKVSIQGGFMPYSFQWLKDGIPFSTDTVLINLAFGFYSLIITDANGCSQTINDIVVDQFTNTVSLNDNDWTVYPIPANQILNLNFTKVSLGSVKTVIRDATGRVVNKLESEYSSQNITLSVQSLPSGWYTIEVITSDWVGIKKVMIQH